MIPYSSLIDHLVSQGILHSPHLIDAFRSIPREAFLHPDHRHLAGLDRPLSIGYNQTNSQPKTVALMLEWLAPSSGQKILDIGSGSGWTTALMGHVVGHFGTVLGLERLPDLVTVGHQNLLPFSHLNTTIELAGSDIGRPSNQYDRILVSAATDELPQSLLAQLRPNGRLVIPVQTTIHSVLKRQDGSIILERYPGFSFVPCVFLPSEVSNE